VRHNVDTLRADPPTPNSYTHLQSILDTTVASWREG